MKTIKRESYSTYFYFVYLLHTIKLQWLINYKITMIAMVTNDYKVTVIKAQEIEKKSRGNLIKTMGLVKLRFPPREKNHD